MLMMITIAIADENPVFCEGLQMMLGQVEGFRVIVLNPGEVKMGSVYHDNPDVLLVDEDIYSHSYATIRNAECLSGHLKTLVMVMDREELIIQPGMPERIHKGSGKAEFTERISTLVF
jgi:DNA-binding NarL/FixJ family response regulator